MSKRYKQQNDNHVFRNLDSWQLQSVSRLKSIEKEFIVYKILEFKYKYFFLLASFEKKRIKEKRKRDK